MSTHAAASADDPDGSATEPPARRFDGPWLLVLAVATGGWTVLYAHREWLKPGDSALRSGPE